MPVPGNPLPDLVMVKAYLALGGFETGLDGPAEAGTPHHVLQQRRPGREHQEQGDVLPVCQRAPYQHGVIAGLGSRHDQRLGRPVVGARAFRSIPGAEAVPALGGKVTSDLDRRSLDHALVRPRAHRLGGLDGHDIGPLPVLQRPAQPWIAAVNRIPKRPFRLKSGRPRPFQHDAGLVRLGPERRILGNAGVVTTLPVLNPVLRQIEFPIEERAPAIRCGIIQEDTDLTILDLARGATVLSFHSGRLSALLDEAGLVNDQRATLEAEVIFDIIVVFAQVAEARLCG